MAAPHPMRSTIMYAFAATTPAPPPRDERPPLELLPDDPDGPEVVIDLENRSSLTPIGDGDSEVSRTFASIPPPPAALLPEAGDIVGEHYRLVRKLGEGTFGRVYVAQRIDVPEHQVALKILPRSLYVGRNVDRELVMLATVGHPHVVQLKDHGTTDEYVWLTMPVYEGQTLQERLEQKGPLSLREAYDIFRAIAYGLEALHDAGLRHQDIKPDNIYLAVFGRRIHPVLLDLGVAAEKGSTFVAGTALYASPEQIFALDPSHSKAQLTEKMDTYTFATTLLVSLVGAQHFPGETAEHPAQLALAHQKRASDPVAPEALPELQGEPRKKLVDVFKKWLSLDPKERPSMTQVAEQLDVLLEKEREEKRQEEAAKERQKATIWRFRVAVAALLVGAIATALVMFNKRETLRLANELEKARTAGAESFDKLDTCVMSHKVATSEAAACRAAREQERAETQRALDAMAKKGDVDDKLREMQTLVVSYGARLRSCEDGSRQQADDLARLEKEKRELGAARDEQKALAEAREKELGALRTEREACTTERASCLEAKNQCIDQKAQLLIACAGPTKPAGSGHGSAGGGAAGGGTDPATGPTSSTGPAPAATGSGSAAAGSGSAAAQAPQAPPTSAPAPTEPAAPPSPQPPATQTPAPQAPALEPLPAPGP